MNKGILLVSFGTSHPDTRRRSLDAMEREVSKQFLKYGVYQAWTSETLRNKVKKQENLMVMSVTEALEAMKQDGITEVIVQPTFVVNGVENQRMLEEVRGLQSNFSSVRFGNTLLATEKDCERVLQALVKAYDDLRENEALLLMGHGTVRKADIIYKTLDEMRKTMGYAHIFLGTMKREDDWKRILQELKKGNYERVCLAPFMMTAGEHAKRELAGKQEDSWKNLFQNAGYDVRCRLQGLGEFESIRKVICNHIEDAVNT